MVLACAIWRAQRASVHTLGGGGGLRVQKSVRSARIGAHADLPEQTVHHLGEHLADGGAILADCDLEFRALGRGDGGQSAVHLLRELLGAYASMLEGKVPTPAVRIENAATRSPMPRSASRR